MNYALGFLAISLAAADAGLSETEFAKHHSVLPIVLGVIELLATLLILWNTRRARSCKWHGRSIDYRFLAELFRTMNYLAPLGCSPPPWHVATQYSAHNPRRTWIDWLFQSLVRQAQPLLPGFESARHVRFDDDYLKDCLKRVIDDWIPSQLYHHKNNADTMGTMDGRIERWVRWTFRFTLLAVLAHIIVGVCRERLGPYFGNDVESIGHWLGFFATILPAFALLANAFRSQAEARRLYERSDSMAESSARTCGTTGIWRTWSRRKGA